MHFGIDLFVNVNVPFSDFAVSGNLCCCRLICFLVVSGPAKQSGKNTPVPNFDMFPTWKHCVNLANMSPRWSHNCTLYKFCKHAPKTVPGWSHSGSEMVPRWSQDCNKLMAYCMNLLNIWRSDPKLTSGNQSFVDDGIAPDMAPTTDKAFTRNLFSTWNSMLRC